MDAGGQLSGSPEDRVILEITVSHAPIDGPGVEVVPQSWDVSGRKRDAVVAEPVECLQHLREDCGVESQIDALRHRKGLVAIEVLHQRVGVGEVSRFCAVVEREKFPGRQFRGSDRGSGQGQGGWKKSGGVNGKVKERAGGGIGYLQSSERLLR